MIPALSFAIAIASAGTAVQSEETASVVALTKIACVDTGLRRAAFEQAGRVNGWRVSRTIPVSGEQATWTVAFRADHASIIMTGFPSNEETDPDLASVCMVSVARPRGDWLAELGALAVGLGLEAEAAPDLPGGSQMHIWSKFADRTLTSAYQPANHTVAVTLSRQIVVQSP